MGPAIPSSHTRHRPAERVCGECRRDAHRSGNPAAPLSYQIEGIDAEVRRLAGDLAGAGAIARKLVEGISNSGALRVAANYRRWLGLAEPRAATHPA